MLRLALNKWPEFKWCKNSGCRSDHLINLEGGNNNLNKFICLFL